MGSYVLLVNGNGLSLQSDVSGFILEKFKNIENMEKFFQLRSEKVLTTFHVKSKKQCPQLDLLLSASGVVSTLEDGILDLALLRYDRMGQGWNEEELKMHFISAILSVADPFVQDVCKTFFERSLSGIIGNYELNVKTDCMVASYNEGGEPVHPYFFLQEFKQKQLWGRTDPQGQMLAAMLLAQDKNADGKHLYGCFVKENNRYGGPLAFYHLVRLRLLRKPPV